MRKYPLIRPSGSFSHEGKSVDRPQAETDEGCLCFAHPC